MMSEMDIPAVAAACVPDLPEDAIRCILARVPDMVSLFRCTVVCKLWRAIVVDPAFLGGCGLWPADRRSSLLGFFVQHHALNANVGTKACGFSPSRVPAFVAAPGSALGPKHLSLTALIHDNVGILEGAKPLAAWNGLLLIRMLPMPTERNTVLRLCVCNMVTGKWDALPPIDTADFSDQAATAIGFAIFTAVYDHPHQPVPADGYSTLFHVIIFRKHHLDRDACMWEFFSGSGGPELPIWTSWPIEDFPGQLHGCRAAAIFSGGDTVNWLFHGDANGDGGYEQTLHAVHVSLSTGGFRIVTVNIPSGFSAWLCRDVGGARLSLVLVNDKHMKNWNLQMLEDGHEDGYAVWPEARSVHVGGAEQGLSGMEPVCVGEKSGTMLVLYRSDRDHAYLLDLHSGSTTMVAGWSSSLDYRTAVPCEIKCLEFFKSRLGVQQ
ncbi:hypothetical protein BS78_07G079400 [Paspalum vaginatum]|nr:hypothetical protein BS78_07G079400 [Paspalum vaginatum]